MSASYHTQFHLNKGKPVGSSIPATEHSVMTSWKSEEEALLNEIEHYGEGVYSCVMDSYDYDNALNVVLPKVAQKKVAKGGTLVLRPDSGDAVEQVLKGLKAGEKTFGAVVNKKGFKVNQNVAVIQGDGINYEVVKQILDKVLAEGYSAQNVAFGMGGGLLQKVNRDTMSFATKLSHITYADGTSRDVMKTPKTDSGKISLPGKFFVGRKITGDKIAPIEVFPAEAAPASGYENVMKVYYDKGPLSTAQETFDELRARVEKQWADTPANGNPITAPLKEKCERIIAEHRAAK
mmetsp:Transcript_37019/g.98398  ORF Transcript_37019/g.98398 Transcript_37019/m.98398 type:complete len:292 (-) Transcript_37019:600-1475(-)